MFSEAPNTPHQEAGVPGLTRHTAGEAAAANINADALTSGPTNTDLVRELVPSEGREAICRRIPMGRLGSAEEMAGAILFLCSEASSYVTGATLDVNGGILMMHAMHPPSRSRLSTCLRGGTVSVAGDSTRTRS